MGWMLAELTVVEVAGAAAADADVAVEVTTAETVVPEVLDADEASLALEDEEDSAGTGSPARDAWDVSCG